MHHPVPTPPPCPRNPCHGSPSICLPNLGPHPRNDADAIPLVGLTLVVRVSFTHSASFLTSPTPPTLLTGLVFLSLPPLLSPVVVVVVHLVHPLAVASSRFPTVAPFSLGVVQPTGSGRFAHSALVHNHHPHHCTTTSITAPPPPKPPSTTGDHRHPLRRPPPPSTATNIDHHRRPPPSTTTTSLLFTALAAAVSTPPTPFLDASATTKQTPTTTSTLDSPSQCAHRLATAASNVEAAHTTVRGEPRGRRGEEEDGWKRWEVDLTTTRWDPRDTEQVRDDAKGWATTRGEYTRGDAASANVGATTGEPLVVSAAGPSSKQAPALRKFGRALKEGYGYENRTAQAARVKEQANAISKLLDEHLSKVSIVFWFKDACPESPIRIEVQPNPPGKCVLQDVRYFMRLINQYSISDVAFYNVNCPDPHWVVQDVGFAIDVKPPQQLLVRNVDLREDQCPGLREKMALITEGAEIPQFIRVFTQGPRAPGSTEPPSTDPDSDFLPIHERHVCDVHDGLLEIIQSKLSVEKVYRTAFPDLSYTSTVPRYLTIFKKAHELSLVPRFVGYGKSERGTWKVLKEAIGQAQEIQSNSEVVFLQVITPQLQACKENSAENHEEPATSKFYMVKQPVAIWSLLASTEPYTLQFADKIQAQGIIDACDFQFMKTKLAYAVPDLSDKNKHCYLWAAIAQEEASGVRFSTLKASTGGQCSQHLRDWSTDAADTLDAFAHYVYQASLGTTSVRNFQGFIAQEADTKLLIFDCDIHRE
ncbi:hypothetical protein D9613_010387 [Agrocybe pediades]|uniref:Alpha-type protein kinase domain-containing protein n=1 Tax=Agrocybe pediades TaxID=84607 RepID=A0A8H4QEY2_9AGAR|nr:hypothetical protein D9613_010387 [Agrocybe pediades]